MAQAAELERISAIYTSFADDEARGRSPLYETLTRRIAGDQDALAFLAALPEPKRQPNLLLAAVRFLYGTARDWDEFRSRLLGHAVDVSRVMLERRTQTNEPARCATLLPLLAALPPPLALLEVGASAGLCLLPDYYAYEYDGVRVPASVATPAEPPLFRCAVDPAVPISTRPLNVAWRMGLDLSPIDVRDDQQVAWLEALVWPDEGDRQLLLRRAVEVARHVPFAVTKGDLLTDLHRVAADAPTDATLVIFHSAVLPYVTPEGRAQFVSAVRQLTCVWISNEGPSLLPEISDQLARPWPAGRILLAENGRPVAWTDSHGTHMTMI